MAVQGVVAGHDQVSLAVHGAPQGAIALAAGRLYWFACQDAEAADLIGRGALAEASVPSAVLVGLARNPETMLAGLADGEGPDRLRCWQTGARDAAAALRRLPRDLERVMRGSRRLCLVQCPATLLDELSDAALAALADALSRWCASSGHRLLMIGYGDVANLVPRLLSLNAASAGVAQLFPRLGALQYQVHYWASATGVLAQRGYRVERHGRALRVLGPEPAATATVVEGAEWAAGGDAAVHLVQAAVLEGAPAFSRAWHVYEDAATLMIAALDAHAASVVFAIGENRDVVGLARLLYRLRRDRGNALKLVVREMNPCLRYADERLLLSCGATLIAPAGAPLARFLTLLETVQGDVWKGALVDDPERLIRAHQAPDASGLVTVGEFQAVVLDTLGQAAGTVESLAMALQPVAGLRIDYVLRQLSMRRRGDIACVHDGQVCLFLFGCRRDGVEAALASVFHLAWREMFDGYRYLALHDVAALGEGAGVSANDGMAPVVPPAVAPATAALTPRRLRLGGRA